MFIFTMSLQFIQLRKIKHHLTEVSLTFIKDQIMTLYLVKFKKIFHSLHIHIVKCYFYLLNLYSSKFTLKRFMSIRITLFEVHPLCGKFISFPYPKFQISVY